MTGRPLVASALVAFLAFPAGASAADPARFDFDATPGALSKDVVPSRYQLSFDVDPGRADFAGEAAISVRVRKAVPSIGLHARELTATSATLEAADGSRRPLAVTTATGPVGWRLETVPPAPIAPGEYTIRIGYTGKVQAAGDGLYVVPYQVKGRAEAMLDTQLEPIEARRLFPSFDEPSFRASFQISVTAPARFEVVSNMPLARRVAGKESVVHEFQPSPPMPTYLVAFAVGRFDSLAGKAAGVPLRILTPEGRRDQARYALEVTRQVLPYFTKYFGTPYALPKLDQLAVPAVRSVAMEDWGLIAYAESSLLFDPATSSPGTRRGVFSIVAHEIAHQWFGNLVTAASWEEIWLNEAFANWMEEKATARFHREWNPVLLQRIFVENVMERDAGPSSRPIRSGPVSESSVADVFDDVTYTKGGAVLSMLEQWVGAGAFRDGLAAYVRERRLSNATAGDLWHHVSRASGKDVASVASSWTDQPGFPLVQVSSRCVDGRTRILLRQERFSVGAEPLPAQTWKIPLRIARGKDRRTLLFETPAQEIVLPRCTREPIVANAGGLGFYRVEYAAADLERLAAAFQRLPPADRVALLGDALALAQAGRTPMSSLFSLLSAVPAVRDDSRAKLFGMSFLALGFLDEAMAGTPAQERVRGAGRALFAPTLARIGWEPRPGDDVETTRLREGLIRMLARFDDPSVIEKARKLFDADAAGTAPLPPATRSAVIQAVGFHSDRSTFDRLVSMLRAATRDEERRNYLRALAAGRDPDRAREFLAMSLSGGLPSNLASLVPGVVGATSPNGALAYEFTLENWGALARLAGNSVGSTAWLLPYAAWTFNDPSWARRLLQDQQARAGAEGDSAARQVATRIELLSRIRERDAALLAAFLATWSPRS